MKYTIDKQEKYALLRLHEEKLDSNIAPNLKSEMITLHAEEIDVVEHQPAPPAGAVVDLQTQHPHTLRDARRHREGDRGAEAPRRHGEALVYCRSDPKRRYD